jgi:hypothetical protein
MSTAVGFVELPAGVIPSPPRPKELFQAAKQNIGYYIEKIYNKERLHSSLAYVPPIEFKVNYASNVRS